MNANGVDPRDVAATLSKMVTHERADRGGPKSDQLATQLPEQSL